MQGNEVTSMQYVAVRLAARPERRDPIDNLVCVWANFRSSFDSLELFVGKVLAMRRDWEPLREYFVALLVGYQMQWTKI